jgi:hypothetical protein
MTVRCVGAAGRRRPRWLETLAVVAVLLVHDSQVLAREDHAEPRVPVGKCVSEPGTLLASPGEGQPWKVVEQVESRDHLLALAGTKAVIEPAPETVRLTLWGNLPVQLTPLIFESSAVLHDTKAYDLDLTLLVGRVVISNAKKAGAARVWLRMPGEGWEITLDDPGAAVALELHGLWPQGVPFSKNPQSPERPVSVLSLQMLKGQADLRMGGRQQRLSAPPGPASLHWDNLAGADPGPRRGQKLPAWAEDSASQSEDEKEVAGVAAKYREVLKEKPPVEALQALLASAEGVKDPRRAELTRVFAVLGLAATGALPQLADVLATSHDAAARKAAILAMRHWIGSAPGRDLLLYRMLIAYGNYSDKLAETVLQLLHSPFDPNDPVTYQTLITYLQHDKLAIRELARSHLYRLVPQGAYIAYNANGTKEERAKAAREWKELIPDGELPKKP